MCMSFGKQFIVQLKTSYNIKTYILPLFNKTLFCGVFLGYKYPKKNPQNSVLLNNTSFLLVHAFKSFDVIACDAFHQVLHVCSREKIHEHIV